MPKKKTYLARIPHLSTIDDKDTDPNLAEEFDEIEYQISEEPPINKLYIEPAGYPIKPFDAPEKLQITVNDPKLFQAYASEQWIGLSVKLNDYIFDQLIIPDYAFKIKKIVPKTSSRIGAETDFLILEPKLKMPKYNPVQFDEIIGNTQAINKSQIIVQYLKEPARFGEWAPKNILFHGPPGTGKTLTAKAIATAANCAFFARKGTGLIGLHVGDGASKIHSLYKQARKYAPAIIFIDELDSIGLNRSFQNVRGDVIEVATALLAEMDGLEIHEGVITIGATNGLELLDPGLRSRFEEEITFPLPNEKERCEMLELFSKNVPFKLDLDFSLVARETENWSGRDLHEKLMKIAVHQAIQNQAEVITTDQLIAIINKIKKQNNSPAPGGFFV